MKDISFPNEELITHDLPSWRALSISDEDVCSDCKFCSYNPGEESTCSEGWPAEFNLDGYARKCQNYSCIS